MSSSKPNLFAIAKSELSQDAILAWLLTWADSNYALENPPLHKTGRYFIESLYAKTQKSAPNFEHLKVFTQFNKIDILVRFESQSGQKHAILIEDKVGANDHSDQLNRYRNYLINEEKYEPENILAIFLKTGYQNEWSTVHKAGFKEFTALDLQKVWKSEPALQVNNSIFAEFGAYLETMLVPNFMASEKAFADYSTQPISEWGIWHWKGFFHHAKDKLNDTLSRAGHGEQQNNREHLLFFYFGLVNVKIEGHKAECEPGLNLTYSDKGGVNLEMRLWVEHLNPAIHAPLRKALVENICLIPSFSQYTPGAQRKGKRTIRLLKLSMPVDWGNLYASDFLNHLIFLKSELQKLTRTVTI